MVSFCNKNGQSLLTLLPSLTSVLAKGTDQMLREFIWKHKADNCYINSKSTGLQRAGFSS